MTMATSPFRKILRGHARTVPGNMLVKFEVRSVNRFEAIIDRSAAQTHTHADTDKISISVIHSWRKFDKLFHLAEIISDVNKDLTCKAKAKAKD